MTSYKCPNLETEQLERECIDDEEDDLEVELGEIDMPSWGSYDYDQEVDDD